MVAGRQAVMHLRKDAYSRVRVYVDVATGCACCAAPGAATEEGESGPCDGCGGTS